MRTRLPAWLRGAVVGCLVLGAVPEIARAQANLNTNPVEAPEVRKLELRGVERVDKIDLERSISTQSSDCSNFFLVLICRISRSPLFVTRRYLDREELARDIIRIRVYYWQRGFRGAEVDTVITQRDDDEVDVAFVIQEHEPTIVRRIRIDYDSLLLREKRVRKLTLLKAGDPLDLVKLDSMRVMFAQEMWGEGHSDATVDTALTVDAERRLADVHLMLIPNRPTTIGDIVVTGLDKVSQQTVLNSITLKPGEPFRRQDVLESQRNLFESNLFRLAAVEVPPQFDSVKRVSITVAEAPLHDAQAGLGVTNIEFVQTDARYSAFNLLGGARRLDITATVGNIMAQQLKGQGFFYDPSEVIPGADAGKFLQPTWAASVDFRQPAFLRRPSNQLGFSAFAHRRSTPGIFIDRGYGGTATLTNHVRPRAPVSLTYRYELNRVDASDVYFCTNYGICEATTINALRAHQRLSPLALTGFIDRSDEPLDPTRGYSARADIEYAATMTASDYDYQRAYLDVAAYDHRGLNNTYAAHVRFGFVRPGRASGNVLHPRKAFYAGGATSVRGYATNQLGPRVLTIDPEKLLFADQGNPACTEATISSCNPNAPIEDKEFNPQPLGGTSLVEGSVEYRIAIAMQRRLSVAFFIDGAIVGSGFVPSFNNIRNFTRGSGAITPGVGIRYKSFVGPIRVDVGYNPSGVEALGVVTQRLVNGQPTIVALTAPNGVDPAYRSYDPARKLIERLTLHFSIGQAY